MVSAADRGFEHQMRLRRRDPHGHACARQYCHGAVQHHGLAHRPERQVRATAAGSRSLPVTGRTRRPIAANRRLPMPWARSLGDRFGRVRARLGATGRLPVHFDAEHPGR